MTRSPSDGAAASGAGARVAQAVFVLLMFAVPVLAISHLIYRFVDRPACTAECEAAGMAFEEYRFSKSSGSSCVCRGPGGTVSHRASYNVTGRSGPPHGLLNALIRFGAPLGGTLLFALGVAAAVDPLAPRVRRWIGR